MKGKKNHYEILGVSPSAGLDAVTAAYKNLAKQYHPDVTTDPGASDRMKELNIAYEVLRDSEKRKQYNQGLGDELGSIFKTHTPAPVPKPAPPDNMGFNLSDINPALTIVSVIIILSLLVVAVGENMSFVDRVFNLIEGHTDERELPDGGLIYVSIKGSQFEPGDLKVVKGATIRWTNMDSAIHIISGNGFQSPHLDKRDTWEHKFNNTGVFEYKCSSHPYMLPGKLTVT
jgi:plastocyanin